MKERGRERNRSHGLEVNAPASGYMSERSFFINFAYRRHTANGARIGGDDGDSRPEEFFCFFFWIRKKEEICGVGRACSSHGSQGFLASKKSISRAWRIMAAVFSWEQNSVEREPTKRAASWGKIRGRVEND